MKFQHHNTLRCKNTDAANPHSSTPRPFLCMQALHRINRERLACLFNKCLIITVTGLGCACLIQARPSSHQMQGSPVRFRLIQLAQSRMHTSVSSGCLLRSNNPQTGDFCLCGCFTQFKHDILSTRAQEMKKLNYSVTEHVRFSAHRTRNRKPFKLGTDPSPALCHVMKPGRRREADGTCHLTIRGTHLQSHREKHTHTHTHCTNLP